MLNKEIVEEIFIEASVKDDQGRILPLPLAGEFTLLGVKNDWLMKEFPEGQIPMVSVGPKKLEDGRQGYSIRKEIVRKKLTSQ